MGSSEVDWPSTEVHPSFCVFEDNIETFLDSSWTKWRIAVETIKASGIGDPKKNNVLYADATRDATGSPPSLFADVIAAATSMR